MAWQTFVVLVLAVAQGALVATIGNVDTLGLVDKPWLTLIVLPSLATLLMGAVNQMKAIGSPPPGVATTPETTKPPQ